MNAGRQLLLSGVHRLDTLGKLWRQFPVLKIRKTDEIPEACECKLRA